MGTKLWAPTLTVTTICAALISLWIFGGTARPYVIDLGTVEGGSKRTVSFDLTSPVRVDVDIEKISTSCDCTVAGEIPGALSVWKRKSLSFEVSFPSRSQKFQSEIVVHLRRSDPILLTIRANVVQQTPHKIDFGELAQEGSESRRVELRWRNGSRWAARYAESSDDRFRCIPPADVDSDWTIVFTANRSEGAVKGLVRFFPLNEGEEIREVPVYAYVTPAVYLRSADVAARLVRGSPRGLAQVELVFPYGGGDDALVEAILLDGVSVEQVNRDNQAVTVLLSVAPSSERAKRLPLELKVLHQGRQYVLTPNVFILNQRVRG